MLSLGGRKRNIALLDDGLFKKLVSASNLVNLKKKKVQTQDYFRDNINKKNIKE